MASFTVVARNLVRNKRRTALSVAGVAVAIFVFGSLEAVADSMTQPVRQASRERVLSVREKARANVIASQLPESLEATVAALPGVAAVSGVLSTLSLVGPERVHLFVHGIDVATYRKAREFAVPAADWDRFTQGRTHAMVGNTLAKQMGWALGQQVELKELGLTVTLSAVIPAQDSQLERHLFVHRAYLQGVRRKEGVVTVLLVKPEATVSETTLAATIDQRFETSQAPTLTVSEGAYAGAITRQFMGFIGYLEVIGLITILVTLLAAINAFSISVRERIREIGLLRTLGYTPARIAWIVVAESMVVALLGGGIGLGLAMAAIGGQTAGMGSVEPTTWALGLGASLLIGFLGGLLPALSALQLSVVDALRVVD